METLCKHNDELTKNVAKLEAIGSTPEAPNTTTDWFIIIATFTAVAIEAMVLYFHRWLDR